MGNDFGLITKMAEDLDDDAYVSDSVFNKQKKWSKSFKKVDKKKKMKSLKLID